MKALIVLLFIIIAGLLWYFFSINEPRSMQTALPSPTKSIATPSLAPTDYSASFAIFTNGTFRIFTAAMYHNLSEAVYIQSDNPNIVHVKKANTTWDDFFKTLPFKLTKECLTTGTGQTFCTNEQATLKFYLNGQRDSDALQRVINPGDQLLISYGSEDDEETTRQLKQIPEL